MAEKVRVVPEQLQVLLLVWRVVRVGAQSRVRQMRMKWKWQV